MSNFSVPKQFTPCKTAQNGAGQKFIRFSKHQRGAPGVGIEPQIAYKDSHTSCLL